jgi:hypothetical protein
MNGFSKNVFAHRNMTGSHGRTQYSGPILIGGLGVCMIGWGLLLGMKGRRVPVNVLKKS